LITTLKVFPVDQLLIVTLTDDIQVLGATNLFISVPATVVLTLQYVSLPNTIFGYISNVSPANQSHNEYLNIHGVALINQGILLA
jgi:hypothetical protein